jgi:hypothetical protein
MVATAGLDGLDVCNPKIVGKAEILSIHKH